MTGTLGRIVYRVHVHTSDAFLKISPSNTILIVFKRFYLYFFVNKYICRFEVIHDIQKRCNTTCWITHDIFYLTYTSNQLFRHIYKIFYIFRKFRWVI